MSNILKFKDFIASIEFSSKDKVFYGKLEGINDTIAFEGNTVKKLESAFKKAVNDYLVICKEVGKEPEKSYKGNFNVRVTPECHRAMAMIAKSRGIKLNNAVQLAFEQYIGHERDNSHSREIFYISLGLNDMSTDIITDFRNTHTGSDVATTHKITTDTKH